MNEIEKMYANAGIEKMRDCENFEKCPYDWVDDKEQCKECEEPWKMVYPPFTAEKQLEIVKVITTNHISDDYEYKYLGIDRDEIDREFYLNLYIDGSKYHAHDKDFAVALAKLVNLIWQSLTDADRAQIKEILE